MAVSSIKGSWHKFFSRIRDYMDVVDSYYRPNDDIVVDGHHSQIQALGSTNGKSGSAGNNKSGHRNHRPHHHHHRHHHHHACAAAAAASQLPSGFSKRKTSQGQVYFVDSNGHKYWYDPSVPKELLTASLNLDALIGRLSSTWEIRNTPTGKTYYVNHIKKTTQFTDPRLVAYKEYLMTFIKQNQLSPQNQRAATISNDNDNPTVAVPYCQRNATSSLTRAGFSPSTIIEDIVEDQDLPSQQQPRDSARLVPGVLNDENGSRVCVCRNKDTQELRDRIRRQLIPEYHSTGDHSCIGGTLVKSRSANSREGSNRAKNELRGQHASNTSSGCPALSLRNHKPFQLKIFSGSQHNLSTTTNRSNTLTGPPPAWFKRGSASNPRKQQQSIADASCRNCGTSNCQHDNNIAATTATRTANNAQALTRSGSISNIYTTSANTSDIQHERPQHQRGLVERNNAELFDKISILRQELLKQQVIAHPCRIEVSRKRIFEESFRAVYQLQPRDLKKRLLVKFRGEEGLDYGGVAREWFYLLSREILNPVHGLFQYTSDDIYNLQINPDSGIVYKEHLTYLNFCGRVIGMAVFHSHFIEGHFTLPFYKMLLRKSITLEDIEFVDPDLHRSLCWILDNDITGVIDTTFLVQHNAFGQLQEHELKENGRNLAVTEENKMEYVSLYVNYRCRRGIESQFEALQRGFYELISPSLVENFDEHELELLIGGLSKIDIEDWRLYTKLKNCSVDTPLVRWFWDIVKSYGEDKRARLLQFVTGSPRVPIQGFKALQGVNSELRLFTIHLIRNACTDNLPKSHTCFNRIDLPPYETYEKLRDKLTQAIEETMGFAMQ